MHLNIIIQIVMIKLIICTLYNKISPFLNKNLIIILKNNQFLIIKQAIMNYILVKEIIKI